MPLPPNNTTRSMFSRIRTLWQQSGFMQILVISCVIALLAFSAFDGAINSDFISIDDPFYVFNNPHVISGLTWDSVRWAFSNTEQANWHPLTWLSHMLDVELYGLNPGMHHLTSLCIHVINALLCFWLFRLLTDSKWQAALIAMFFAIHPLRAESVVWVSERKDVLCALFGLLSLITYIKYVHHKKITYYASCFIFLLLGLLAKSMIVTWPFIFLLLDYWPLGRLATLNNNDIAQKQSVKALIFEKIPFFLLIVLFSAIAYFGQASEQTVMQVQAYPLTLRVQNIAISYVRYLGMMLAPHGLAIFYPLSFTKYTFWKFLSSLLLLTFFTWFVVSQRRKRPYLCMGWFWYLGTLVPVIGLVHISLQAVADRYTYLPSLGIMLIIVSFGSQLWHNHKFAKPVLTIAAASSGIILLVLSWVQTGYWQNGLTILQRASHVTKANPVIWSAYGKLLEHYDEYDLALEQYNKLMALYPDIAEPWVYMGRIYLKQNRLDKAEQHLMEAYGRFGSEYPELLMQLSQLYSRTGRQPQADAFVAKAIESAKKSNKTQLLAELEDLKLSYESAKKNLPQTSGKQ